jgi:hypothetical protein
VLLAKILLQELWQNAIFVDASNQACVAILIQELKTNDYNQLAYGKKQISSSQKTNHS